METKYPNTLVSSREDKILAYADNIHSNHFNKSIEDKVLDLDVDNRTNQSNIATNADAIENLKIELVADGVTINDIKKDVATNKTNINTNTKNVATNTTAITNLQITTNHITNTLSTEYYTKDEVNTKLGTISQNTWCTSELVGCSDTSHEAYIIHIRINKSVMNIHYITSVTIKLRTNLVNTLGNTSCIINNGDGTRLGTSKNMIHQYNNTGKYVTWYFDPIVVPSTEDTILLEFHLEGGDYAAQLGIHVNPSKSEGATTQDQTGVNHSDWCPALGFNVTPLVQLDLYNKLVSLNS